MLSVLSFFLQFLNFLLLVFDFLLCFLDLIVNRIYSNQLHGLVVSQIFFHSRNLVLKLLDLHQCHDILWRIQNRHNVLMLSQLIL